MFKRILLSLGIIAVVGSSAVVGTRALLSDTATLTANSFSTGTVDLQIARDDTGYADTQTGFTLTNLFPGQTGSAFFWLRNNSTVEFTLTGQVTDLSGTVAGSDVDLRVFPVDGTGTYVGGTVTGPFTLAQWNASPQVINNLLAGVGQRFKAEITIHSNVTVGGGTDNFNMSFVGTQVAP